MYTQDELVGKLREINIYFNVERADGNYVSTSFRDCLFGAVVYLALSEHTKIGMPAHIGIGHIIGYEMSVMTGKRHLVIETVVDGTPIRVVRHHSNIIFLASISAAGEVAVSDLTEEIWNSRQ